MKYAENVTLTPAQNGALPKTVTPWEVSIVLAVGTLKNVTPKIMVVLEEIAFLTRQAVHLLLEGAAMAAAISPLISPILLIARNPQEQLGIIVSLQAKAYPRFIGPILIRTAILKPPMK